MGPAFSPLDERLGLLPGTALTPWLVESIVQLGAWLSFARVPPVLEHFTGVTVSAETVRRLTEAAGRAALVVAEREVTAVERGCGDGPQGPPRPLLSVDGAMVPVVDGEWAEVKTLVLGELASETSPRATQLSYYSRLADADTFGRGATGELHRRGTATAERVIAVTDGAVWCQGVVDLHRPDAVRILDFPHAAAHLAEVAPACFGSGTATASTWLETWTAALRHGREDAVLTELTRIRDDPGSAECPPEAREVARRTLGYLASRREQIRYAIFTDLGYPIGSGCVESANKLVVEARLKGAGRHWARSNVNPMLALRTAIANDRWDETWAGLWPWLRRPPRSIPPSAPPPASNPLVTNARPAAPVARATDSSVPRRPKTFVDGKPTAQHPWRRYPVFRAKL